MFWSSSVTSAEMSMRCGTVELQPLKCIENRGYQPSPKIDEGHANKHQSLRLNFAVAKKMLEDCEGGFCLLTKIRLLFSFFTLSSALAEFDRVEEEYKRYDEEPGAVLSRSRGGEVKIYVDDHGVKSVFQCMAQFDKARFFTQCQQQIVNNDLALTNACKKTN